MRTTRPTRLAGSLAGLTFMLAVGTPAVLAKEGVEVNLAAPISSDAQPGDVVAVFFTLTAIGDGGEQPLGGSPIFIRLVGAGDAVTEAPGVETTRRGTYKAMVEIPAGGALRAEFGLRGFTTDGAGREVRSDIVWPFDGILVSAKVPAPVDPETFDLPGANPAPAVDDTTSAATAVSSTDDPSGSLDPRPAVAGVLAIALAVAGVLIAGRRRPHGSLV